MSRRTLAIVLFALLALAEVGDMVGLVLTLSDPSSAARLLGISPRAEIIRAIILVALALLIALNGAIALAGALVRSAIMFQFGALMAGVGLALYGIYQVGSAALQHGHMLYAAVGLVYIALGALALWFARQPLATLKKL